MSQTLQVLKDKAKLHLKQNQWIDAKRILMQMLKLEASNDVILTKIGEVNEKLNEFDDAHYYYQQAIKINPKNIRTLKQLGLLYQYVFDDPSKAEQYYIKYNNINSSNDFIHFNLAKIYTKQQKYQHAAEAFKKCDFEKAAVNYHFAVYLLSIDQPQNALKHFQRAANIKPYIVKYSFEYGKLCVKLKEYKQAKKAFTDAGYANSSCKLSECRDAEVLFANALCAKYFGADYYSPFTYINLAFELNPTHVPYKYFRLKCLQNDTKSHWDHQSLGISRTGCSLLDSIYRKVDLLASGYFRNLSIYSSIPSDLLSMMYKFFYSGSIVQMVSKMPCEFYFYSAATELRKQEMVSMFFDALCPGRDESKLIFAITKLIDGARVTRNSRFYFGSHDHLKCFILLKSIFKIVNIYNTLSIIEQTEDYFNYKLELMELFLQFRSVKFLFLLFNDNAQFIAMYKSLEPDKLSIPKSLHKEMYGNYTKAHAHLKYIRLIIMKHIFGIDDENNEIKNSVTTLKTLSNCIDSQITWNTHQ
eukprot:261845_1